MILLFQSTLIFLSLRISEGSACAHDVPLGGKIFHFYYGHDLNYYDAYTLCNEKGQNLITINNLELSNSLNPIISDISINYWIGLQSTFYEEDIILKSWHWNSTSEKLDFTNWCPESTETPKGKFITEMCGYIVASNQCWESIECQKSLGKLAGVICEDDNPQPSSGASMYTTLATTDVQVHTFKNVNYYIYENSVLSQSAANELCQRNGRNLVTIYDAEAMTFLYGQLKNTKQDAWIGLESYACSPSHRYWKWSNSKLRAIYENWCPGQVMSPDQSCAYASHEKNCWVHTICDENKDIPGFICEDKLEHTNEYDVVLYKKVEYFVFNTNSGTFQQARDKCSGKGKRLVTFDRYEKAQFFTKVLAPKRLTFWIGLESVVDTDEKANNVRYVSWKWISTNRTITIQNWCPNNKLSEVPACVYMQSETMCWKITSCADDKIMSFICEDVQDQVDDIVCPA